MTITETEPVRIRIGDKIQISPRGKRGIWTAEFFFAGQHRHRSLKTANLKTARQRAMALEVELTNRDYTAPKKPTAVSDAIKQFMTSKKGEGRASKTLVKYQFELDNFDSFISKKNIRGLTQLTAKVFDEYRSERKIDRSAKTLHTGLLIIKTFIKWTVSRELMDRNPFTVCKVLPPYVAPKTSATLAQVNAILEKATGPRRAQFAMLAFTGIRAGELQHLRPHDVDLEGDWVHVRASGGWQPKTGMARQIPIHPRLKEIIVTLPNAVGTHFFCAASSPKYLNGGHFINTKHLNEAFQALAVALGMNVGRKNDGLVIHSLRHFFETQAVDSGIPQFVVDTWMGHVGHSTTGRIYYGLTHEKSQTYMKRVTF